VLPSSLVAKACEAVNKHYRAPNGECAITYACEASAGAGAVRITAATTS
jgi:hypothetical protein